MHPYRFLWRSIHIIQMPLSSSCRKVFHILWKVHYLPFFFILNFNFLWTWPLCFIFNIHSFWAEKNYSVFYIFSLTFPEHFFTFFWLFHIALSFHRIFMTMQNKDTSEWHKIEREHFFFLNLRHFIKISVYFFYPL